MYPFSVPLGLPIKDRVLIPCHHLLLLWHLSLPSLQRLTGLPGLSKCRIDGGDHVVDHAQAFALAGFLGGGEAPRDFPGIAFRLVKALNMRHMRKGSYHKRPPEREDVLRNGPNMLVDEEDKGQKAQGDVLEDVTVSQSAQRSRGPAFCRTRVLIACH